MKSFGLLIGALLLSSNVFAAPHYCEGQVKSPAAKLFALHYEIDLATATGMVDDTVTVKPSLLSPNRKMRYSVLETNAYAGKMGQYRIRLIYAVLGKSDPKNDCILMGQEILDLSSL